MQARSFGGLLTAHLPSAPRSILNSIVVISLSAFAAATATADTIPYFFSTGNPDGKIGTLSGPGSPGLLETETADDFITTSQTTITNATFVGLLPLGAPLSSVDDLEIEFYNIFPVDSANPPSGKVPTRTNSPSDNEFAAFDSAGGSLTFTATLLSSSFSTANTVVSGIHTSPNQFTGGEGAATGEEVLFNVAFNTLFHFPPDTVSSGQR